MSPPIGISGASLDEEGSEDGGLGGVADGFVVHRDGLHGGAEDVGEQDEFLALVVGDVSGGGEELDAVVPFVLGEADFADEGVQVPGQGLHQLLQPRVFGLVEGRDDGVDELLLDGLLLRADAVDGGSGQWWSRVMTCVLGAVRGREWSPAVAARSSSVRFSAVACAGWRRG